ncbi:MAG: Nucleotide-diphospho-sugar transferase domain-containing protein [Candidatus Woesebacteria bacterium GW2011_GWB1_38_8]|uniref:Nucleotide-diphospho-sugar transferase domain-containing protein n=1 Tax=Candidatus Woesebacteria bacterium GW2011_GWB1_38_8 TaxID=1618570 RepID=A0A0G0NJU4_9BACT|nr:MAG: Nucleotide-diphospho-sugar transferase domain-containing protein [Candidatus Woesebacteria bacterium GW2011_GWB1_38_8]
MLKTPLLFLIFNRPSTTAKVFAEIRKIKPKRLFIAADGPRDDVFSDKERCIEARKITENIDWKCNVTRLYRESNLGCKKAVSSAIDWFFENVEEGIILEDDIFPNQSFFKFCERMLALYRKEKRIMHIGGVNFQNWDKNVRDGYYFSKYVHIWGWASWKRAWKGYDVNMQDWPEIDSKGILDKYYDNLIEKIYWNTIFEAAYSGKIDTWDYQFVYHIWKNGGISIVPNKNLVSNIGFGKGASHTSSKNSKLSEAKLFEMNPSFKNKIIKINSEADIYTRKYIFKINLINILKHKLYYKWLV